MYNFVNLILNFDILKKVLPVILVILLLFNTGGFYIIFKSLQYRVKKEIKEQIKCSLPDTDLSLIKMNKKDARPGSSLLKWYEEGKEFVYRGRMYDVVKQEIKGDTIYYYCINDIKEEQLFAVLNGILDKTMQSDGMKERVLKRVFQLSQNFYVLLKAPLSADRNGCGIIYYPYTEEYLYIIHDVPIPPPKYLS